MSDQIGPGSASARVTWQVNAKNKVTVGYIYDDWCECHFGVSSLVLPEASVSSPAPESLTQITWSAPVTNRLLFDAGASFYRLNYQRNPQTEAVGPSSLDENGIRIRSNVASASTVGAYVNIHSYTYTYRASLSYVTGSHAFKVGGFFFPLADNIDAYALPAPGVPFNYQMTTLRGRPNTITYLPTPETIQDYVHKTALFAQDQWTVRHLTLNAGLRFDWFRTGYPDGNIPANSLLPERVFPGAKVLNWKDLSPRLGLAYDVFGNGRTALKASLSRYVVGESLDFTRMINPAVSWAGTLTRTWNDIDGDFVPKGDPLNPAAHDELGPSPNNTFGKLNQTLHYDPAWASGFDVRPSQWEMSAGVQHQLIPQVSVSGAYFRRVYGNFLAIQNVAVSPSDYSPYSITAPSDPRLPGGGGQPISGLFDLNPSKVGQLNLIGTSADNFGTQLQHWNGVDLTINARLPKILLQGGLSTGRTLTDNCEIVEKASSVTTAVGAVTFTGPSSLYCRTQTPFLTQVKFLGSYTLPWQQIQMSFAFQSAPGPAINAIYTATNAVIAPSLGRNLSAGATSTAAVNLVIPGTLFGERLNQLDVRLAKTLKMGRTSVRGMVGVYNLLNVDTQLTVNNSYGVTGTSWLRPNEIVQARLLKFEGQLSF